MRRAVAVVAAMLASLSLAPVTMQTGASRAIALTFDDLPATRTGRLAVMQETTAKLPIQPEPSEPAFVRALFDRAAAPGPPYP